MTTTQVKNKFDYLHFHPLENEIGSNLKGTKLLF